MLCYFFRNLNCSSLDPLLDNNCRALWSYLLLKFFTGFSRMSMMWLFMPLLLWHNVIWERRNKLVFQRVRLLFDLVFQQADSLWSPSNLRHVERFHTPPTFLELSYTGGVKVNFDTSMIVLHVVGFGFIVRDHEGYILVVAAASPFNVL